MLKIGDKIRFLKDVDDGFEVVFVEGQTYAVTGEDCKNYILHDKDGYSYYTQKAIDEYSIIEGIDYEIIGKEVRWS